MPEHIPTQSLDYADKKICEGRFDGKVAVITGGANGIGRATAVRYVAEGGKVAIIDTDAACGAQLAEELGADKCLFIEATVTDYAAMEAAADQIVAHYGRIDSLVNSAATTYRKALLDADWDFQDYKDVLEINLNGVLYATRAMVRKMIDLKIEGSILLFSSMNEHLASAANPTYVISKGGISTMVKTLAVSFAPYKIRINVLAPGFTDTPFVAPTMADKSKLDVYCHNIPLGRIDHANEQAACALFLISDDASYVTGAELVADGGTTVAA